MPAEQWKPVVGYPDYDVSDLGRVRSYVARRPKGPLPVVLAGTLTEKGYRKVALTSSGKQTYRKVHLLVLEAFVGPRPTGLDETRHLDGQPDNNRLTNLAYGTRLENQADAKLHGSYTRRSVRKAVAA